MSGPATRLDEHVAVSVGAPPPALLSDGALADVRAVARRFPAAVSEFFGFECRLADPAPRADFLFCSKAEEGGREVLAGLRPGVELPRELLEHPVWQRVREFAREWARPGSPLFEPVRNLWFEFDLAEPASVLPLPSVFFGTEALQRGAGTPEWLVDVLARLRGGAPGEALLASLARCVDALPDEAHVFQLGMMLARPGDLLRVCIRGVPAEDRVPLLERVGWPGDLGAAGGLLADLVARADSVDLDLDLLPGVGPKLGLECSFWEGRPGRSGLPAFVEALVERGLCTPDKGQGLLAWSGGVHERKNPDAWPADLRRLSEERGPGTASAFLRWPYHIKLVHQDGRPAEAKAYLAVRQFWPTPDLVRQVAALHGQEGAE